jgi:hypothetical protein
MVCNVRPAFPYDNSCFSGVTGSKNFFLSGLLTPGLQTGLQAVGLHLVEPGYRYIKNSSYPGKGRSKYS